MPKNNDKDNQETTAVLVLMILFSIGMLAGIITTIMDN